MGWNDVSLLDPSSWVPTFGNFCGPGWTAGQRNSDLTPDQIEMAEVSSLPGADGKENKPQQLTFWKAFRFAYGSIVPFKFRVQI